MPPMSIAGQPKSFRMSVTVRLAPASLPQMNISGGPPGKSGLNICAYPTVLKAFTTCAEGSHRCTCSPAESVCPTASSSPFGVKTRGLIASMTTLPAKFSAPASWMAFSAPAHDNASTITSPNFTASAKVPVDALIPEVEAHATAFSLCASRDPIFTSCPSAINPFPSVRPTSPVPRIPIFKVIPPKNHRPPPLLYRTVTAGSALGLRPIQGDEEWRGTTLLACHSFTVQQVQLTAPAGRSSENS